MIMVWYVDYDVFDFKCVFMFDDLFYCRDQCFVVIKVEMFGVYVFYMQEFFEVFCFDQFVQDCFMIILGKGDFFVEFFDVFFQLRGFFGVGNVYVLQGKGVVVGVFYDCQNFVYCGYFEVQNVVDKDWMVYICIVEFVGVWVQFWMWGFVMYVQWVKISDQVIVDMIGVDDY